MRDIPVTAFPAPPAGASYTIAVRALCEFTAKAGDLDLRFTPSPTGQEGTAGHQEVAARRGQRYQTEITLEQRYRHLHVRGRADGYCPDSRRLEEIKTYRGDLQRMPANHRALHWAQAKIYGHLYCEQHGLADITLALVYFNIGDGAETVLEQHCTADELQASFIAQCEHFLQWADQELAHRAARNRALSALVFPYPALRPGQRALAESVYRGLRDGRMVLAQAPTGIGKTLGTLFPALKACPTQGLDKIFFLTAKTSGRQMAIDALQKLRAGGAQPLRTLELVARDKACEHPDKSCHGDSCPLARGFYDRLPAARRAAVALMGAAAPDSAALRELALAHSVCPYYLAQELVRWSDVVVADYNYYFDTSAMLHALARSHQWQIGLLVDEAHNLIERGRAMYTAELKQADWQALRRSAPPAVRAVLARLNRACNTLYRQQAQPYRTYPDIPASLASHLQKTLTEIGDYLAQAPAEIDPPLLRFYFDALHFARLAEQFGPHSVFDVSHQAAPAGKAAHRTLCLRNIIPAPFLAPRFAAARAAALFSATLDPAAFYRDTLGLPSDTRHEDVQSPFQAAQLRVRVVSRISTRFRDRDASVDAIVALMARQYRAEPGNYLAFCGSFDYLEKLALAYGRQFPDLPAWRQSRGMDEAARAAFLARFTPAGRGVGFAVLGGAFSEGIDLPGSRLIGAFIVTLGLPQMNPVNEQIMRRMQSEFGEGYAYAYLYPGLRKVVQAAGRVIRSETDRGALYLIDDRFRQAAVRRLLPRWWRLEGEGEAAPSAA
jgi:DNA excision repair protein ERCC-2